MTISVKLLNDQIKKISETNSLLDMLLEFEKTLDSLNLYAFKNWLSGEVLEGPTLRRHYVNVKLLYPYKQMPDPEGAKRLIARDCLVEYKKDTLIKPVRVKTYDDVQVDIAPDGRSRYKAKTQSEPCWVVSIDMPRKYVDEFSSENVEVEEDQYVNMDDLGKENEPAVQNNMPMGGALPGFAPTVPMTPGTGEGEI